MQISYLLASYAIFGLDFIEPARLTGGTASGHATMEPLLYSSDTEVLYQKQPSVENTGYKPIEYKYDSEGNKIYGEDFESSSDDDEDDINDWLFKDSDVETDFEESGSDEIDSEDDDDEPYDYKSSDFKYRPGPDSDDDTDYEFDIKSSNGSDGSISVYDIEDDKIEEYLLGE